MTVIRLAAVAAALLISAAALAATDAKDTLFDEARAARAAADEMKARTYAPNRYVEAVGALDSANTRFDRGGQLSRVEDDLNSATALFSTAARHAEFAQLKLASLIKVRTDAFDAGGRDAAPELWEKGETWFANAINDLERGSQSRADRAREDAEEFYREAELIAIKGRLLGDAREALEKAAQANAKRYAPATYELAESMIAEADKALAEDRYDADRPRSLAEQAKREAEHAAYLAKRLAKAREDRDTSEDLILEWEKPLEQIAEAANLQPDFANGFNEITGTLVSYIEDLQEANQRLEQDLNDRTTEVFGLQREIEELSQQLGGVAAERSELAKRLEAQAEIRARFARIESEFSRDEARVFREGDELFLRLTGLKFESGQYAVGGDYGALLGKVIRAIQVFPDADVIVEGHTDSFGGDKVNFELSQKRAEAVRDYILDNSAVDPSQITGVGFGETQPVGNNDTPEGRAKNRRIDIRLQPKLPAEPS